nr:CcoQ/FixQ family Cbb3-type cytochrome c oxidase assembly chaperone [Marichromatium gracile]
MTVNDWIGTILTVVVFVLMVVAYFLVFRPKNRDRLESMKHIPFDDDDDDDEGTGARDGRP